MTPPGGGSPKGGESASFLGRGGPLAAALPGFEQRDGQIEMADGVEATLRSGGGFIVEAGTGIGKSFAYLIPALLAGRRVVISTATRNLQDQLFERDLPALQKTLGSEVPVERVKGRENYICKLRWAQFRESGEIGVSRARAADLKRVGAWEQKTATGDRDELRGIRGSLEFWRGISTVAENCIGSRCEFHGECHLMTLRKRAEEARILIVNHHRLVADLRVRENDFGWVLPDYDALIVDEAHRLEDVATQAYAASVSSAAAERLTADVARFLASHQLSPPGAAAGVKRLSKALFARLAPPPGDEAPRTLGALDFASEATRDRDALIERLGAFEDEFNALVEGLARDSDASSGGGAPRSEPLSKRIRELRDDLEAIAPRPGVVC